MRFFSRLSIGLFLAGVALAAFAYYFAPKPSTTGAVLEQPKASRPSAAPPAAADPARAQSGATSSSSPE